MNIWVYALADGSLHQITRGGGGDFQPNWAPDGKSIAFFSSRAGNADIWLVDLSTKALKQLTTDPSLDINPFFSPDGTKIASQSDRSGRMEIWIMSADGSGQRQLTNVGVMGHFLRWSRDGSESIFRCLCGGKSQSMQMSAEGGEPRPTAEVLGGSHMSLSPDYLKIMDVVGHKVLWVSPLKDGHPEEAFEFPDRESRIDYPVWSPDGRWVLFDRFKPQGGNIWMVEKFD